MLVGLLCLGCCLVWLVCCLWFGWLWLLRVSIMYLFVCCVMLFDLRLPVGCCFVLRLVCLWICLDLVLIVLSFLLVFCLILIDYYVYCLTCCVLAFVLVFCLCVYCAFLYGGF